MALSGLGFVPWLRKTGSTSPPEPPLSPTVVSACAAAVGLLGLLALASDRSERLARASGPVAVLLLILLQLGFLFGYSSLPGTRGTFVLFEVPAWALITAAGSVLWGSALARREFPGSPAARQAGRRAAKVLFAGFALSLVHEAMDLISMLRWSSKLKGMGLLGLYSCINLFERVLLFWSGVESLRPAGDESVVQARAVRIHQLMSGWFLFIPATLLLSITQMILAPSAFGARIYLWNGVVYGAMSLTTACLLARRYRLSSDAGVRWVEPPLVEDAR
jgi:hypothetical protein